MKFLRIRDVRQLARLQYPSPEWTKLRNFIKGLLITVTTAGSGGKGRPIKDIVLQAGHYEFQKDGMSTTVEVLRVCHCLRLTLISHALGSFPAAAQPPTAIS